MNFGATLTTRWSGFLVCAAAFIVALGPAQWAFAQDEVWLRHFPAHPTANEQVWVAARVQGGPYQSIRITYDLYKLSESNGNVFPDQSLIATDQDAGVCDPLDRLDESWCFAQLPSFGDSHLVGIKATATPTSGGPSVAESYLFASGKYPATGPIPIRRTGPLEGRLDVVLMPDRVSLESTDSDPSKAIDAFSDRLSTFVNDIFFGFPQYGGTPGNPYRRLYNFYYTQEPSEVLTLNDPRVCKPDGLPVQQGQFETYFDAISLLHCRDADNRGGYLRSPSASTSKACLRLQDYKCSGRKFMTTEIDYPKTVAHEMGHLLHNLTDEYCGPTKYNRALNYSNVFETEAGCQSAAASLGYQNTACTQICPAGHPTNFWKIFHPFEPSSIMDAGMHEAHSRFFNASIARILLVYLDCVDNDICYDGSASSENGIAFHSDPQPVAEADFEAEAPAAFTAEEIVGLGSRELLLAQSIKGLQQQLREPLARIGEQAPAAATLNSSDLQAEAVEMPVDLGVEVEVEGTSAHVIGIEPISPPELSPPSGSPTLTVTGHGASGETIFRTEVPDPRWIEVEGQTWLRSNAGTITVPLPDKPGITDIVIESDESVASSNYEALAPSEIDNVQVPMEGEPSSSTINDVLDQSHAFQLNIEDVLRSACQGNPTASICQ